METVNSKAVAVRGLCVMLVMLVLGASAGCASVGYYSQAVTGHMRIVMGKKPLAEVTQDVEVNEGLRRRIELALKARDYAINELGLPDNNSYTTFYDTKRNFVTWNVVATGEFSFAGKQWCFPIAGCVSYKGYYDNEDAKDYADDLAAEGLDVAINGATAYSTLGWFADPLLNTMLNRSDAGIVSLLFHELAHQQLYVGDDSKFNESFASFVEQAGLELWQSQFGNSDQLQALQQRRRRHDDFIALLRSTRDQLQTLYDSKIEQSVMRQKKAQIFNALRDDYETLKQNWNGYRGYDGWFGRPLNNARLVAVATYNGYIPAFEVLFERSNRDFQLFYKAAQALADLPKQQRTEKMRALLEAANEVGQSSSS